LLVSELGREDLEGHLFALVLGPHVHADTDLGRDVGRDDTRVGLVPRLAARPSASGGRDLDFAFVELEGGPLLGIELGDRDGGGLNTTLLLSGRDALISMASSFVLEQPFGSSTLEED